MTAAASSGDDGTIAGGGVAYARVQDEKRALAAGFQEHLAKPIDPDVLVGTIAELVKPPKK